jgi:hypothetical protein
VRLPADKVVPMDAHNFDELKSEGNCSLEHNMCSYDCRQDYRQDGNSHKCQREWDDKWNCDDRQKIELVEPWLRSIGQ